jgi:hypothetical protein
MLDQIRIMATSRQTEGKSVKEIVDGIRKALAAD